MVECVFTLDYEIYGNGEGSLATLVSDPTERLADVFSTAGVKFVPFVEVAEFEMIERTGTDAGIGRVREQVRRLYQEGFFPGLHLHPQWYGARFDEGRWVLDFGEYNLCVLPKRRIVEIVDRALSYFSDLVGEPAFRPLSFRAGNWLFQPSREAAAVLFERGIRIDSSVFKGGIRHEHQLDYRAALENGYYWRFNDHAHLEDPQGQLLEVPIFTEMVPFWRMTNAKRLNLERQSLSTGSRTKQLYRMRDMARLWHPLKLDFCRMTLGELTGMIDSVLTDDRNSPQVLKPVVAIGHSKELVDFDTIETFLVFLRDRGVAVSTFEDVYSRCA